MSGASLNRIDSIVAGGKDTVSGDPSERVFKSNGVTGTIVNVSATLVTPRHAHASFAAGNDQIVFCAGTSSSTTTLSSAEVYTVTTDILTAGNPMTTARRRCTGIKSPKDTGMVIGGVDSTNNYTTTLEEYNYVTKVFSNSLLTHDRTYMSASQVVGALVLVSGGEISTGMGDTTQKYFDLVSMSAITVASVPAYVNRSRHVSFGMLDGTALITSGVITTSPTLTTISEYHIPQLAVNQVADIVFPVMGGVYGACGVQDSNLFVGGLQNNGSTISSFAATVTEKLSATDVPETMIVGGTSSGAAGIKTDSLKYNAATDAYKYTAHSSVPTYFGSSAKCGDGLIKACGIDGSGNNSGSGEMFDGQTETFTVLPTLLRVRRAAAGGYMMNNGNMTSVVCGGETTGNTKTVAVDEINPLTKVVSAAGDMTVGRGYHQLSAVNVFSTDVDGVVMGGSDGNGAPFVSVHKREQAGGTFSVLAATMTTPRSLTQGDQVNELSVAMTGGRQADNVISNLVSVYTYPGSTVTHTGTLAKAREKGHASRLTDKSILIAGGRNNTDTNETTVEKLSSATWTTSQLNVLPSARHSVSVGSSQLSRTAFECKTANSSYFKAARTTEQYNSGIASLKIEKGHTQVIDIPTTIGSAYTITVWMRRNSAYTDRNTEATAPKINLCGCGIGHKASCLTVSDSLWTSYTVTGTASMDGVARLYITNASALPGAVIYVDDITKV